MRVHGPERLGGQGLDPHQEESGNRAIHTLLTHPVAGPQIDLLLTWRGTSSADGAYEVWSTRGMVRFRRLVADDGSMHFDVLEMIGVDPVAEQDPLALATVDAECAAAAAGGFDADDPARRFIAPEQQTYPFAYERIAQLFDSPNAPDIAVSPRDWCSGSQPGTHGALHVRQARAPLWFSGPGVRPGEHHLAARAVDIAPTCLAALGFPFIDGCDASGRTATERGVEPDVLIARQDGRVLHEILDQDMPQPQRLYVFLLDGMHQTDLLDLLDRQPERFPHLLRLRERAARLEGGSTVNFPSITWPSHTTILTGTWCGHHDVVNPSYYLRDEARTVSPQGAQVGTEIYASTAVESLYEAFHRHDPDCVTAAIHAPFGRSARHAVLEGRNLCDRARLKALTADLVADQHLRWTDHPAVASESLLDTRGVAQVIDLFTGEGRTPPRFVYHELALTDGAGHDYGPHSDGVADALEESDRRIGRVLALLDELELFDETLVVVTADHGMAPQQVELRANPTAHVADAGLSAVIAEPMIWLRDIAVSVERAADRRTARVLVAHNDADADGERPPLGDALVRVARHVPGAAAEVIAEGSTDRFGVFGFATPSDVVDDDLTLSVAASGLNSRHLRFDGSPLTIDLRAELYGLATPTTA